MFLTLLSPFFFVKLIPISRVPIPEIKFIQNYSNFTFLQRLEAIKRIVIASSSKYFYSHPKNNFKKSGFFHFLYLVLDRRQDFRGFCYSLTKWQLMWNDWAGIQTGSGRSFFL